MEQICTECDFDASAASPTDVATALPGLASAIANTVRSIPAARRRTRPAPDVWAPVECLGHLREAEQRTVTLDGAKVSSAEIARSAWHECHHHHGDIQRTPGAG